MQDRTIIIVLVSCHLGLTLMISPLIDWIPITVDMRDQLVTASWFHLFLRCARVVGLALICGVALAKPSRSMMSRWRFASESSDKRRRGMVIAIGATLFACAAYTAYCVVPAIDPQNRSHLLSRNLAKPDELWYLSLLWCPYTGVTWIAFTCCVAPLVEEFIYRGLLQQSLFRLYGNHAAILITALLFTAAHFYPQSPSVLLSSEKLPIACTFVVAGFLSWASSSTGSLLPSFLVHSAFNYWLILAEAARFYFYTASIKPGP